MGMIGNFGCGFGLTSGQQEDSDSEESTYY